MAKQHVHSGVLEQQVRVEIWFQHAKQLTKIRLKKSQNITQ